MSEPGDPTIVPTPSEMETQRRWAHSRLVRRMLDGAWQIDLQDRIDALRYALKDYVFPLGRVNYATVRVA